MDVEARASPFAIGETLSMRRTAVVVTALCVLAVACSGDDDPETGPSTPDQTAATTDNPSTTEATDPPATTDAPAITTSSTTSTSRATTTSTTVQPVATIVSPEGPDETAALEAFRAFREYRVQCLAALPNCDVARWAEFVTPSFLVDTTKTYTGLNEQGMTVSNLEGIRDFVNDVGPVAGDADRVRIMYCSEDATTTVTPSSSGPVANDTFVSYRSVAEVERQANGTWLVANNNNEQEAEGREDSLCRS